MSKPLNKVCLECSKLSQKNAILLHGPGTGTACWNPKNCPRKRSHYRHRRDNNERQRAQYRDKNPKTTPVDATVESISIPVLAPPVALIYLYREKPQDSHLHALAVSVWQGSEKLAEIEAIHCMGMTNTQVRNYLNQVLKVLRDRYGITEFEPAIRMEPSECEIAECPLKDKLCSNNLS
ncbi:hypothetical protein HRE53_31145 (plasmid) [Acaryochloris sp. 'Moss Beach']|uniref:hypothetical protein n=1 Tax=Acaryochloris sp. 'Moss Beach' TaxID=2740837 RepID=UPI001F222111|nr:hypothetical protein [Acaryochloris sp. 'Moss Beach']UJB73047.1 hypothetical protein HRE53_31145 [Acaryochloris sp. 'Moss Beach']